MIRIGIVEDDAVSRKLVLDYLRRYEEEHGEAFEVSVFEDGAQILKGYRPRFDVLLLDIQMGAVDGMTTAKRIREVDEQTVLVFITSSPQFAIKGYEVDATSYLLKPLPWFAFEQELSRSIAIAKKRRSASLLLQSGQDVSRVDIADVVYVESVKHRLEIHTVDAVISVAGTLREMEVQLEGRDFFRSNSGYLVNLAHVRGVRDQSCVMTGGHELRISRPRKKDFLFALAAFAGGVR